MIYITKKNVWVALMNKKGAIFWIFNSQRYVNICKCVGISVITFYHLFFQRQNIKEYYEQMKIRQNQTDSVICKRVDLCIFVCDVMINATLSQNDPMTQKFKSS